MCPNESSSQWNVSIVVCECHFQDKVLDCWNPALQGSPPPGLLWKHVLIGCPLKDWSRLECWVSTWRMAAPWGGSDLQMTSNFVKLLRFFHFYCSIPCNLPDGDMKTGIENIHWNSFKTYQDSPISLPPLHLLFYSFYFCHWMCYRNNWNGQGWEHFTVIFLNEEEDFYKHQNQKVLTFENLQRQGLTMLASCHLYLPYDLVMGLWVVRNVTLKPALENRVYCKDNEGSHKCRKKLSNQALGRTEKKNRFKIVSLSLSPSPSPPFLSSLLLNLTCGSSPAWMASCVYSPGTWVICWWPSQSQPAGSFIQATTTSFLLNF